MNKRIVACVSVVAIMGVLAFFAFRENGNIEEYRTEIDELSQAIQARDNAKINELLERRVAVGRYSDIEEATKTYLSDVLNNTQAMVALRDSEDLYTILDGDSLEKDDSELSASRKKIAELRERADKIIAEREQLNNEENISEYLSHPSDETKDLLNNTVKSIIEDDKLDESYTQQKALVSSTIDIYSEALDYLSKHSDGWQIKNSELTFSDSHVQKKYLAILDKASSAHAKEQN